MLSLSRAGHEGQGDGQQDAPHESSEGSGGEPNWQCGLHSLLYQFYTQSGESPLRRIARKPAHPRPRSKLLMEEPCAATSSVCAIRITRRVTPSCTTPPCSSFARSAVSGCHPRQTRLPSSERFRE